MLREDLKQMMISAALESKRLFVCDYSMLATMKSSRNGKYQKYNSAPIALFEMPEDMAKRNVNLKKAISKTKQ